MKRTTAFLVCICMTLSCMVLDGSDRQLLRDAIAAQPPPTRDHMKTMVAVAPVLAWLKKKPQNDEIFKILCRQAGGDKWVVVEHAGLVEDMVDCLMLGEYTYVECGETLMKVLASDVAEGLSSMSPTGGNYECKGAWDFRYEPESVPGATKDLNRITIDDMVNWVITAPVPPAGFALPKFLPLLPRLCPLNSWGCPEHPLYPGPRGDRR